jgi:hypothetical protein
VATSGELPGHVEPVIDHIALSPHLRVDSTWAWPNVIAGQRLTDHSGAGCEVRPAVS